MDLICVSFFNCVTLLFGAEKRLFQWTGVFYREKGKWKVLTTHATALRN
jgi:hypothetical protein